jgi:beta-lactam-binding protein with PASTA domain
LKGSDVTLVVSTGRPVVPDIAPGTAAAAAFQAIRAAHLTPAFDPAADRYDTDVSSGAVVATNPAADTALSISAQVVVVRSKGPPPAVVPDVAGKSVEDARDRLLVAGLRVGPDKPTFDVTADDGTVLGTDPAGGKAVATGSSVSLLVATSLTVPSVRGESEADAEEDLRRSGFTVSVGAPAFDSDIDPGSVIGTVPAEATKVDPVNATVTITLSNAVVVPDVTQGDVGAARQQLGALGLNVHVIALIGASGASVISQNPSGGSRVAPGSAVSISAFP